MFTFNSLIHLKLIYELRMVGILWGKEEWVKTRELEAFPNRNASLEAFTPHQHTDREKRFYEEC